MAINGRGEIIINMVLIGTLQIIRTHALNYGKDCCVRILQQSFLISRQ